jgi:hypothetical protein
VTEYDKVWPDEPEPAPPGEEKKKKKTKEPEAKYYAHHKY